MALAAIELDDPAGYGRVLLGDGDAVNAHRRGEGRHVR